MNLPVTYVLLRFGFAPECAFITAIVISQCCLFARLIMLKNMISLMVFQYLKQVYANVIVVSILSIAVPVLTKKYFLVGVSGANFILLSLISIVSAFVVIWIIGCNDDERLFVKSKVKILKDKILRI